MTLSLSTCLFPIAIQPYRQGPATSSKDLFDLLRQCVCVCVCVCARPFRHLWWHKCGSRNQPGPECGMLEGHLLGKYAELCIGHCARIVLVIPREYKPYIRHHHNCVLQGTQDELRDDEEGSALLAPVERVPVESP